MNKKIIVSDQLDSKLDTNISY